MLRLSGYFYQFTGMHAFLTGLVPFYLPVVLWRETGSLATVSGFISLTSLGFLLCLMAWETLRTSRYSKLVIAGSFIAEAALISLLISEEMTAGITLSSIVVLALLNGVYGCFYWLSLRTLFIKQPRQEGYTQATGNRFGNFQLIVGVLLKVGILSGAFLLEAGHDIWLIALSLVVSGMGIASVFSLKNHSTITSALEAPAVSFKEVLSFRAGRWSRRVFFLDGLFLFLESYFWVLSLYLISNQSFARLGITVVGLAVILSLLFLVIKKRIDGADANKTFVLAVGLYALSWVLRAVVDKGTDATLLSVAVIAIAFMTSFFRLSFNKLFFDQIEPEHAQVFILGKSWFTQAGVAFFFGVLSVVFFIAGNSPDVLAQVYWASAFLALPYILYIWQAFPIGLRFPFFPNSVFSGKRR